MTYTPLELSELPDEVRQKIAPTKQELWQWLKAERQWQDKVHQWLRVEGVNNHVLAERRLGRPEQPGSFNRAARRARKREFMRSLKRIR